MTAPKVFLSHASADKDPFVRAFAERLVAAGIQVWLDEWDLRAGDSLPREILDNIADSESVVVVLSTAAVGRPWVREELDSAKYQQVTEGKGLIPVILGDLPSADIPSLVKHLHQVRVVVDHGTVADADMDSAVDAVVSAIFGTSPKRPPLGEPPAYTNQANAAGLDAIQTGVLRISGEIADAAGQRLVNTPGVAERAIDELQVSEDQVLDALEVLEIDEYIDLKRSMAGRDRLRSLGHFKFTTLGLGRYFDAFVPDSKDRAVDLLSALANGPDQQSLPKLREQTPAASALLTDFFLEGLEAEGVILVTKGMGPGSYHIRSRAGLNRMLL